MEPLCEYFCSPGYQASLHSVDEGSLSYFLVSDGQLFSIENVTVFQFEFLESHTMLVVSDEFFVWQGELDIFGR